MQCIDPLQTLPRRLSGTPTRSAVLLGSDPGHVAIARRWAAQATRSGPLLAESVATAVSELVTNALRHTASGLPGGTVHVGVKRPLRHLELLVTDNGPRSGKPVTYPRTQAHAPLRPDGSGFRVLDGMCAYWEWEQARSWAVTVRVVFPWERSRPPHDSGATFRGVLAFR